MTTASTASTLINPLKFLQLVLVFCSSSVQKNSSSKESKTVNVDKDKDKKTNDNSSKRQPLSVDINNLFYETWSIEWR